MRWLPFLAVAALLLVAGFPPAAKAQTDAWTFLVYMDADNNLEPVAIEDFMEMSSVGSTDDVNIVVYLDRSAGYSTDYGDWTDGRRFYVTQGMEPTIANAIPGFLGEINMAEPFTLSSFVTWGMTTYPAEHYFLVLWDHGDGWQGVVIDNEPISGDSLTAVELHTALADVVNASGRTIDVLGNDACRMSLEIQYELADFADYFVGSEKDEPLDGWPYDTFLGALVADPTLGPAALASVLADRYVESYEDNSLYSVTLAAVSAAGLRSLVPPFDAFLSELMAHEPYFRAEVVAARAATEHYEIGGMEGGLEYDLYHFVENVIDLVPSRRVERAGLALMAAIEAAVVHERHWDNPNATNNVRAEHAHGLSLWFPVIGGDPQYALLAFSAETLWNEFLSSYSVGSPPFVVANPAAVTEDADSDGRLDQLVLRFQPEITGTMAVDVYVDGAFAFSREYACRADRLDELRFSLTAGGFYEVTFYLFDAGELQNLTIVRDLVIEQSVTFRGKVTGADGKPLTDARVTLVNVRTGERVEDATDGGEYAIAVDYPTWFEEGDPLRLELRAGDREMRLAFNASRPADGEVVRDLYLNTVGMGFWYVAIGFLAAIAIVGITASVYFWRKYWRFRHIP